ncbi:ExeA family protein [Limnobaculum parvum]|uniref:Uncharacterized protein n=1 Tax=Limnobaculum parvum TaxID=2172103 RepID=A0A2Y9TXI2_9GAMM|nr:ExeA family protein [Limnobaculum parvum]AWH88376.1 hypothetical protein HYN51_07310 [Limnobaculum parvum]
MYLEHFKFGSEPFRNTIFHNNRFFLEYFHSIYLLISHACNKKGVIGFYSQDENSLNDVIKRIAAEYHGHSLTINASPSLSKKELVKKLENIEANHQLVNHGFITTNSQLLIITSAQCMAEGCWDILKKRLAQAEEQNASLTILLCGSDKLGRLLPKTFQSWLHTNLNFRMPSIREYPEYFEHQLAWNDGNPALFSPQQIRWIYRAAKGKLSLINRIAHYALLGAYAERSEVITQHHLKMATKEITGSCRTTPTELSIALASVVVCLALGWAMLPVISPHLPHPTAWNPPEPDPIALPEPKAEPAVDLEIGNQITAMRQMYKIWGYDVSNDDAFCEEAGRANLQCKKGQATLEEMEKIGYPWVAEVKVDDNIGYVNVVRVGKTDIDLLVNNRTWQASRSWFEQKSTGQYIMFYRLTPLGRDKIDAVSSSSEIAWLDKMLSRTLLKPKSKKNTWSPDLMESVKQFQKNEGLKDDGRVGSETLMKLALASGDSPKLIKDQNIPDVSVIKQRIQ